MTVAMRNGVPIYITSSSIPLTQEAALGRRVKEWDPIGEAWGREGVIVAFSPPDDETPHIPGIRWDGKRVCEVSFCDPMNLAIADVSDEMVARGADALFDSWRRQGDPEKVADQRRTALAHARIVLEAALRS